jgi:hypothetical protein
MENDIKIKVDFYNGCKVEILGIQDKVYPVDDLYRIEFFNNKTGKLIYSTEITPNHWTRPDIFYFIEWRIFVYKNNEKILNQVINLKNEEVLIAMESKPIGDCVSWIPHILEFSKQHKCKVTVQTYFHELFSTYFPYLNYVKPQTYQLNDEKFYASYVVQYGFNDEEGKNNQKELNKHKSWNFVPGLSFWDKRESPFHPNLKPLAEFGSSVLGLDPDERRPIFTQHSDERPVDKKYICISEFASGIEKHWQNQIGWQTLVDDLSKMGYEIISISKEKSDLKNIRKRNGNIPLNDRIWYLQHCEFFIGVSSGLSWLAWACGKKVVMISGITKKENEFKEDCIRIINENVCNGCWNLEEHCDKFAMRKINFCPEGKNFTCSRSISPKYVLEKINEEILNNVVD